MVPDQALNNNIYQALLRLPHVIEIHHMHLWSLDGEKHVLTAHLVLNVAINGEVQAIIKQQLNLQLNQYNLAHTTIEFEQLAESCRDSSIG